MLLSTPSHSCMYDKTADTEQKKTMNSNKQLMDMHLWLSFCKNQGQFLKLITKPPVPDTVLHFS